MTTGSKILAALAVVGGAFLGGYVPKQMEVSRLQTQLSAAESRAKVDALIGHLSQAHLEAAANNYGHAGEHASQFFTNARLLAEETADERLKGELNTILAERDRVTALAAQADPATTGALAALLKQLIAAHPR